MTITERIAAAIKPILDEDRRADRERIAELERDGRVLQLDLKIARDQLDELDEKCAALLAENKRLLDSTVRNHSGASLSMLIESELKASQRAKPEAPTLRIDTDMSDPQPGKLLVVRLDEGDVRCLQIQTSQMLTKRNQIVGFLVETPAVEVKRGAWVVVCDNGIDPADYWTGFQWSFDIGKAKRWTEQPTWDGAGRAVFMADLEVIE